MDAETVKPAETNRSIDDIWIIVAMVLSLALAVGSVMGMYKLETSINMTGKILRKRRTGD